ncbi:MAG: ABC transporter substrate-binding protein [Nocardiopsaceae bacterium]|nr:ABC transporter substrate-binding protein [Nocardiopsaceae bacterium]
MRLFYKLVYSLAAVVPTVALAACSAGHAAVVSPPEQPSITVEAVPTADEAGLYVAADQGLFRQQGLNVTIVPTVGGGATLPALNSGQAQLVAGNYVSFVRFQAARQADLRIIAGGSLMKPGNQVLYVMPGSQYRNVDDLADHHAAIGVNTKNDVGQLLIGALMQAQGNSLDDVTLQAEPDGFSEEISKLKSGQLGAAWLPEPFGTEAQQQLGAVPLADLDQGPLSNFPIGCYIGTAKWVRSHPDTVAAFLRALKRGQEIADTSRPAVERAMQKHLNVPQIVADTMTVDSYPLDIGIPQMQRVANEMYQFRVMPPGFSYQGQPYQMSKMIQSEPAMINGG